MADKRISELDAVGTSADTDQIPVVQGGTTKRATLAQLMAAGGVEGLEAAWSNTVVVEGDNATRTSRATAVQTAIDAAAADSKAMVFVPHSFLNYDASAVTFNSSVRMVREGQLADVFDVKAYGAAGDGVVDDTPAVQAAIDGGESVYFPDGVYLADSLTFNNQFQQFRFETGARLEPKATTTKYTVSATDQTFYGFRVDTSIASDVLLEISASGTEFYDIQIIAPNAVIVVDAHSLTGLKFFGGEVKGKTTAGSRTSTGIRLRRGTAGSAGTGANEVRAFGLTVHHHVVGILAEDDMDDLGLFSVNIENCDSTLIRHTAPNGASNELRNLNLYGVHLEGAPRAIEHTAGQILGLVVSGCRLSASGSVTIDVAFDLQATVRGVVVQGCFASNATFTATTGTVWNVTASLLRCIDLMNQWDAPPNFTTGAFGDRVLRVDANTGDGREFEVPGWMKHTGSRVGFFDTTPVGKAAALTAANASTVDTTYGTEEADVINNIRTRLNEVESRLQAYGLLT